MEILLLKDVETLGREGAVVRVKPGFARNYLVPRGLAVPATAAQLKMRDVVAQQRVRKLERARAGADALKRKLESRPLTLTLTVGEDDKPFGSITAHDLVEALRREEIEVEKPAVRLDHPLKTLGAYEIPVRVHPDVTATLKVRVVKA